MYVFGYFVFLAVTYPHAAICLCVCVCVRVCVFRVRVSVFRVHSIPGTIYA